MANEVETHVQVKENMVIYKTKHQRKSPEIIYNVVQFNLQCLIKLCRYKIIVFGVVNQITYM